MMTKRRFWSVFFLMLVVKFVIINLLYRSVSNTITGATARRTIIEKLSDNPKNIPAGDAEVLLRLSSHNSWHDLVLPLGLIIALVIVVWATVRVCQTD